MTKQHSVFDNLVVVIGAMKCATTSLHYYLSCHPDIHMSTTKELDFFVAENNWKRGVDWYARKFDASVRLNGESSPNYTKCHYFKGVPERMHGVIPNAKLIYVVRDPLNRLLSHFTHNVSEGRERGYIDDALAGDVRENHYVLTSCYHHQLTAFLAYYPEDRIMIVDAEDLRSDRRPALRRIFTYLDINPDYDDPRFDAVRHDSTKKRRPNAFSHRLYELPGGRYMRYALRNFIDAEIEKPVINPAIEQQVREVLAADAEKLRAFSGKTFSSWSV